MQFHARTDLTYLGTIRPLNAIERFGRPLSSVFALARRSVR